MSVNRSPEAGAQHSDHEVLPASPPPSVLAAVAAATVRAESLAAAGRELHFAIDADGALGIEIRRLDGTVLGRLSPTEALRMMSAPDCS